MADQVPISEVFHDVTDAHDVLIHRELERYAMERDNFKYMTTFYPAFARPLPYGSSGVNLWFVLKGKLGAVQFAILTNWHLEAVEKEFEKDRNVARLLLHRPLPGDVGYHSPRAMYEGQEKRPCHLLEEGFCYYDGSSLAADRVYQILLKFGSDGVWDYLHGYYNHTFGLDAVVETLIEDREPQHEGVAEQISDDELRHLAERISDMVDELGEAKGKPDAN